MSVSLVDGHIDGGMTDNEIIKALECCSSPKVNACDDCPFYERCYENDEWLEKEAIDLINRQKAEIERLQTENRILSQKRVNLFERLEIVNDAREKAVKEFAEMIKKNHGALFNTIYSKRFGEIIDNLVKEMMGEGNV